MAKKPEHQRAREAARQHVVRPDGSRPGDPQPTPEQGTTEGQATPDRPTHDPGPTPARNVRIDDYDWQRLKARAAEEGTSAGAVIRRLVRDYLRARG